MGNKRVKTSMLRSSLLLSLCAVVTMAFGGPAVFAAKAGSTTNTANTYSQQLKVSPVRTDITINAGSTGTVRTIITNITSSPITVQPIENDFVAGGEEGQPALILSPDSYAPSHSLKRFMKPLANVTIPPQASMPVTVSIVVPAAAQAGGYFGALRFAPVLGDGATGSTSVALGESVASLILMTVPGPTVEQLTLTNFEVQQDGSSASNFRNPNDLSLFVRFENKGNLQEVPFGQMYVQKGKKILYTYNFNQAKPQSEILPDSFRRWNIPLKGMGKFGKYTVGAIITYGTKGQSIDISKTIWIIPTAYILVTLLAVGVLVVLIGGTWIFLKSYKRRILKSSHRRY